MSIQSVQNLKTQLEENGTTLSDFMLESTENLITVVLMFASIQDANVAAGLEEVLPEEELQEIQEELSEEVETSSSTQTYELVTTSSTPQLVAEFDLLKDGEVGIMKVTGAIKYTQYNRLYHSVAERTRGIQKQGSTLSLGRARWGFLTWNRYAFYPYYQIRNNKVQIWVRGRNGIKAECKIIHKLLLKY